MGLLLASHGHWFPFETRQTSMAFFPTLRIVKSLRCTAAQALLREICRRRLTFSILFSRVPSKEPTTRLGWELSRASDRANIWFLFYFCSVTVYGLRFAPHLRCKRMCATMQYSCIPGSTRIEWRTMHLFQSLDGCRWWSPKCQHLQHGQRIRFLNSYLMLV